MDNNLSQYEHLRPGPPKATPALQPIYCYICGRQFGSKSIGIHQPQCLKKWKIQNEQLPKELRRHAPEAPKIIRNADNSIDVNATNMAAYEASLAQLIRCANCGRKLAPERLQAHQRACTKEHPGVPISVLPPGQHHRQPHLATSLATKKAKK
uniref:Zinc finger protein 474 n=1 Tax=Globodera rostochiensis TaxID=31243 RepID=A0A914H5F6_GLORO